MKESKVDTVCQRDSLSVTAPSGLKDSGFHRLGWVSLLVR